MPELTKHFNRVFPLIKVDETNRTVTGVITDETPDKSNEIFDYAKSKPYYIEWSNEIAKATDGKNLGNVREMHKLNAVGKLIELNYDDEKKCITGTAKIVDNAAWEKCVEGVYTGFSHGGDYVGAPVEDGDFKRYTAKPAEVSIVDNPCNSSAHFTFVKADGSVEERPFVAKREFTNDERTKLAGEGKALPNGSYPIVNESDLENAISAFGHNPTDEVKEHIKRRAKDLGAESKLPSTWESSVAKPTDVEKEMTPQELLKLLAQMLKTEPAPAPVPAPVKFSKELFVEKVQPVLNKVLEAEKFQKGLHEVKHLAGIILDLAWLKWGVQMEQEYEKDEKSPLPADLQTNLESLSTTLLAMASEEVKELVASSAANMPPTESAHEYPPVMWECGPMYCAAGGVMLYKASSELDPLQQPASKPQETAVVAVSQTEVDGLYKASTDSVTPITQLALTANPAEKGTTMDAVEKEKLEKAHSATVHLGRMAKAVDDFHTKVIAKHEKHLSDIKDMHAVHQADMHESIGKLQKMVGPSTDAEGDANGSGAGGSNAGTGRMGADNEPHPTPVTELGTPSLVRTEAEGTMTVDIEKMEKALAIAKASGCSEATITKFETDIVMAKADLKPEPPKPAEPVTLEQVLKIVQEGQNSLVKALFKAEDDDDVCPKCGKDHEGKCAKEDVARVKAESPTGLGNRDEARPRPVVTHSVSKAGDTGAAPIVVQDEKPADVRKALGGNQEEALKLMRGTKAEALPSTIADVVSGLK